jgi:hypothetical protein
MPLFNVVVLRRAVLAIRLNPVSGVAIEREALPPGTLVEGAASVLAAAEIEEAATVTVGVRYPSGRAGLSEIRSRDLRNATADGS